MPPPGQKKFECEHCQDAILVAVDHSSTSSPYSVCQQVTSSPPLRESYSEARGEDLTNIRDHSQPASSKPTDQRKSGGGAGLLWGLAVKPLKKRRSFVIGTDQTLPDMKIFYEGGSIKRDDLRADYFSEWARARTDADRGICLLEYDRPKQFEMSDLFSPITEVKSHFTLVEPDLETKDRMFRDFMVYPVGGAETALSIVYWERPWNDPEEWSFESLQP
jgi:hypothetical protein